MATRLLRLSITFVGILPPNILCRYSYNIINDYNNLIQCLSSISPCIYESWSGHSLMSPRGCGPRVCSNALVGETTPTSSIYSIIHIYNIGLIRVRDTVVIICACYRVQVYYSIIHIYNIGLIRVRDTVGIMCMLSCASIHSIKYMYII